MPMNAGLYGKLISPSEESSKQFLHVFFGVFGRKGIADVLMGHQFPLPLSRLDVFYGFIVGIT